MDSGRRVVLMISSSSGHLDEFLHYMCREIQCRLSVDDSGTSGVKIHIASPLQSFISSSTFPPINRTICYSKRPHSADVRFVCLQTTQPMSSAKEHKDTSFVKSSPQPNLSFSKLKHFKSACLAYLGVLICTDRYSEPLATFSTSITGP